MAYRDDRGPIIEEVEVVDEQVVASPTVGRDAGADAWAIAAVKARYLRFIDLKDWDGLRSIFTDDAVFIASLVNPPRNPKAHYFAGPEPVEDPDRWRTNAEERRGTWWEDWASWVIDRTDGERKAPARLGSRRHKPLEPAPGSYVRDLEPVH